MRTVVLGNDGVHEWGVTYDEVGRVLYSWHENLEARRKMLELVATDLQNWDWFAAWRD